MVDECNPSATRENKIMTQKGVYWTKSIEIFSNCLLYILKCIFLFEQKTEFGIILMPRENFALWFSVPCVTKLFFLFFQLAEVFQERQDSKQQITPAPSPGKQSIERVDVLMPSPGLSHRTNKSKLSFIWTYINRLKRQTF